MSMLANAARGIKNIWSHGDEDFDAEEDDLGETGESSHGSHSSGSSKYSDHKYGEQKYSSSNYTPSYGGGSSAGNRSRSLRSVPIPLRAREKNIYTLRPKSQDEAAIAADYLKAGSAVVVNLESVENEISVRIIDFMSGVCYGLESQGHAMKLGDSIFLFTPGEFEISSDELDYCENREFFFKDIEGSVAPAVRPVVQNNVVSTPAPSNAYTGSFASAYNTPQQYHNVPSSPASPNASSANTPMASSSSAVASQPAARAQTLPASSVYGTSGKAHVTIGGRPAPTSVMTPAPRQTSSSPMSTSRSWER